jgi:hypothetical protein
MHIGGATSSKATCHGLEKIFHCPTGDDCVKPEYYERGKNPEQSDALPSTGSAQITESAGSIATACTAEGEFGAHYRYAEYQYEKDINKQECGAAMSTCFIGEPPDIT